MSTTSSVLVALVAFFSPGLGDVYLHNFRGSNNRLDEQNRERANGNRMFDSENNNRGGYNVGKMRYYHREKVPVGWTNQHGTTKYQMGHSEVIGQYKCDPLMRDGTTTRTIPTKATECYNYDCDTDVRFGRHESLESYRLCEKTQRNTGLLTINQNLKGTAAKYTRQNPQGTRHGYECPEERDYYPYWRDNDGWVDAFILTADTSKCAQYQAESQNVKPRHQCKLPDAFFDAGGNIPNGYYPLTEAECVELTRDVTTEDGTTTTYTAAWTTIAAYNVSAPVCTQIAQTRANHLGNPGGKDIYEMMWEIPDTIADNSICAFRLRYNITTDEYAAYETGASVQAGLDSTFNSQKNKPNANNDPSEIPIWADYGLTRDENKGSFNEDGENDDDSREYVLKNNPRPDAFGDLLEGKVANDNAIKMQLAINTAQYGRGFQDRSHTFIVMKRPDYIPPDAKIIGETVRGKRGNIVQTYPATEYFFYPPEQYIPAGEYLHAHWTGSNTNPNNNDGQGKQGTDRSNICCTRTNEYDTSAYSNFENEMTFEGGDPDYTSAMTSYPAYAATPDGYEIPDELSDEFLANPPCLGITDEARMKKLCTTRDNTEHFGNMEELDDAGTSFEMEPFQMNTQGCWNILGTRNNNFSNRDQKGKICVSNGDVGNLMVSAAGAEWHTTDGRSGATFWPSAVGGMERARLIVRQGDHTDTLTIADVNLVGTMTVDVQYAPQSLHTSSLMWQDICDSRADIGGGQCAKDWAVVEGSNQIMINDGHVMQADVSALGTYKVVNTPNWRPILALTVALLAFVVAMTLVLWKKGFFSYICRCGGEGAKQAAPMPHTGQVQVAIPNKPPPPPVTSEGNETPANYI